MDFLGQVSANHICTDNTTTTPLGANATFTGAWQDCLQYQEVNISIDTDQNSANNGLVIQRSADGVNVADTDVFNVYANRGTNYTPNPAFRYVRVIYTNGSVAQTRFSLMTILRRTMTGGSFHRISDTLKDDSDGRLNLSVLKLRTAQDNYVSGAATNAGNFKVSLEEHELENNPLPVKFTDLDSYVNAGLDPQSDYIYIAGLKGDGAWYIQRMEIGGHTKYCFGTTDFDTNWTNRTSITYKLYNDI